MLLAIALRLWEWRSAYRCGYPNEERWWRLSYDERAYRLKAIRRTRRVVRTVFAQGHLLRSAPVREEVVRRFGRS
jgi:hypothetical protein